MATINTNAMSYQRWRKRASGLVALADASDRKWQAKIYYREDDSESTAWEEIDPCEIVEHPRSGHYDCALISDTGEERERITSKFFDLADKNISAAATNERVGARLVETAGVQAERANAKLIQVQDENDRLRDQVNTLKRELSDALAKADNQSFFDDETGALVLDLMKEWMGKEELRAKAIEFVEAVSSDPVTRGRILKKYPEAFAKLANVMGLDSEEGEPEDETEGAGGPH